MMTELRRAPEPVGTPEHLDLNAWRESVPASTSAGARLRQAREALGLSQSDVSARLHLTPQLVDALESDDLEQGPGPMYMRGYLRTYARMLEIPAEEILSTMPSRQEPTHWESVSTATPPPKVRPQVPMSDWPVRWATYAIGLVLVALSLVWLWGGSDSEKGTELSAPDLGSPAEQTLALPDPPAQSAAPVQPAAPSEPAPPPAPESLATPLLPQPAPTPEPVMAAALPLHEEAPPAAGVSAADAGVLRMSFSDACWVRVTDRNGKVLKNTTVKMGDSLEFQGGAPYQVVLGNGPSVAVEFDGERFDTAPHTHNAIARFTVGNTE